MRSRGGKKILHVAICHYSNWKFAKGLRSKSRSVEHLRYIAVQEAKSKVKVIRTDLGGEYMNLEMGKMLEAIGAKHETSASGVSQQNGRAEKSVQDVMGKVRINLQTLCRGLDLWAEAANYAVYHLNRMPCYSNPDMASPYFMCYGRHPNYKELATTIRTSLHSNVPEEKDT